MARVAPAEPISAKMPAGVDGRTILVMVGALVSLFVDQSFGGVFTALQTDIGGSMGASGDDLPWTSIGYNTFYYVLIILTPWLITRFGRRQVFTAGHLCFAVITVCLMFSTSLGGFVALRCLQGVAQGTFFVCAVATVLTLFPPALAPIAFSVFSVTSLSGAASGSLIGGWFLDHAYWRDAFALYACLALFAGVIIWRLLDAPGRGWTARFDLAGVAFAFVAFSGYQYASSFGERRDWFASPDVAMAICVSVVGFAGFIWRELCEDRCGFIQLRLFHIRNLSVASVLGFGLGVPLFGANLFVQYAETSLGFPYGTAGALLALRIPTVAIVAPLIVLNLSANRIPLKLPVAVGFVLVPLSYAMLAFATTSDSEFTTFALAILISGMGFACLFSPIAGALVRSLPVDVRPEGVAIFKLVLLLGGSIATTALGVVYDHSFATFQSILRGEATLRHFEQVGIVHPTAQILALVGQQASVLAYADNSLVVAGVTLLVLPFTFLLQTAVKKS
jgi:DHA2 family multidrug resistance protein